MYWPVQSDNIFLKVGTPSASSACFACSVLLSRLTEQSLHFEGGLSDQKINKGSFVRVEKLSFLQSPVKIHDVVGTPKISNFKQKKRKLSSSKIHVRRMGKEPKRGKSATFFDAYSIALACIVW